LAQAEAVKMAEAARAAAQAAAIAEAEAAAARRQGSSSSVGGGVGGSSSAGPVAAAASQRWQRRRVSVLHQGREASGDDVAYLTLLSRDAAISRTVRITVSTCGARACDTGPRNSSLG
jgi:type II secretory pathway component HofQ